MVLQLGLIVSALAHGCAAKATNVAKLATTNAASARKHRAAFPRANCRDVIDLPCVGEVPLWPKAAVPLAGCPAYACNDQRVA
jgi:hypothetical protein